MEVLLYLFILGISVFMIIVVSDWFVLGFPMLRFTSRKAEKKYLLNVKNRIDIQKGTDCAGYSTAHVLRSFGVEADGKEMYVRMPGKLKNGAVLPKNVRKVLKQCGVKVSYCIGNLNALKEALCQGKRVIAFVKTRKDKHWLHYVSIVGYNEQEIFIADSLGSLVNCEEQYYNRRLTNEEFLRLWDTREIYMPFYKNTFLVVEK